MNLSPLVNSLVGNVFESLMPRPAVAPQAVAPAPAPVQDLTMLSPEASSQGALAAGLGALLAGLGGNFGDGLGLGSASGVPGVGSAPGVPSGVSPVGGADGGSGQAPGAAGARPGSEAAGEDKAAKKAAKKEKRKLRKAAKKARKKAKKGKGGGGAAPAGGAAPTGGASPASPAGGASPTGPSRSAAPSRMSPSRIPSSSPVSRGAGSSPVSRSGFPFSGGSPVGRSSGFPAGQSNGSSSQLGRNLGSPVNGSSSALPGGNLFPQGTPTKNSDAIHITQVYDEKYNPDQRLMRSSDCGPTSLAMGLKALGIGGGTNQERTNAARFAMFNGFDSSKDGVDGNGNFAANEHQGTLGYTNTDDIKRGATAAGARPYDVGSSSDIARAVGSGNPVVLAGENSGSIYGNGNGIDYNGGHFILVSGYDPKSDTFTINDPLSHGGALQISRAQLEAYQTGPGVALGK